MEFMTIVFLSVGVIGVFLSIFIHQRKVRKRRIDWLASSFGKSPDETEWELDSISRYAKYREADTSCQRVDAITWNDLDMDRVFARINTCLTSVGEEYL